MTKIYKVLSLFLNMGSFPESMFLIIAILMIIILENIKVLAIAVLILIVLGVLILFASDLNG